MLLSWTWLAVVARSCSLEVPQADTSRQANATVASRILFLPGLKLMGLEKHRLRQLLEKLLIESWLVEGFGLGDLFRRVPDNALERDPDENARPVRSGGP